MKKKLSSFITAVFVLLMCVFASACGDRYKDLEFKVYYAFSEDSKDWHDASEGISLTYYFGDGLSEDESSLVFDEYGANLYLKIEVGNVKAKYIDTITVSATSTSGLDFSSTMVKENQVFALPIFGNVNTSLKIYENNSGKKYELPIEISRKLEAITADLDFKPAMPLTANGEYATLSLLSLNNLTYHPAGLTNQTGVTYSVYEIGGYTRDINDDGINEFDQRYDAKAAKDMVVAENGMLKIKNDFLASDAYVIRVKATSVFFDGSVEGIDPIETIFDVYVVDSSVEVPTVKFSKDLNSVVDEINIYENGGDYATTTIAVDISELPNSLVYRNGVYTNNVTASYGIALYVLDKNGKYVKCDFENQEGDGYIGINGLYIKKLEVEGTIHRYTLSIASRDIPYNTIKVAYELEGFDYSHSQGVSASREIVVYKDVLPTSIIVNDTITMKNNDRQEASVYSTNNAEYKGLALKLTANPNSNPQRRIKFDDNPNLKITNVLGQEVTWINSGETIYVKFVGDADQTELKIKTLSSPEVYDDNEDITEEYLTITYVLTKQVTANRFKFVKNVIGDALTGDALITAGADDVVYVKVYYSGGDLDPSTINLTSSNPKLKFENDENEMSLADELPIRTGIEFNEELEVDEKFDIYAIPVRTESKETSQITILAGDEIFTISQTVNVSSVFVMSDDDAEGLWVDTESAGAKEFNDKFINSGYNVENGAFNFAIARGENVQFTVKDASENTNTIFGISVLTEAVEGEHFSTELFSPLVVSNSTFDVISYISGKTQVLNVAVSYYALDGDQITIKTTLLKVQIAVFDSIGTITRSVSKQSIGFINDYYKEISSSEIRFNSYTLNNGTPSNSVYFTGLEVGTTIKVDGASQIKIGLFQEDYQTIKQNRGVEIYYVVDGERISLLEENGTVLIDENDFEILNGSFTIELQEPDIGLDNITLTLTALRFGNVSNVWNGVTINIAAVDKAERIVVDGDFVETSDNSKELQMSFMDVVDGGVDVAEFDADIEFGTQSVPQGMIRFDDVDASLTHILYRYQLDEDGNFKYDANGNVKYSRIDNDFFNISIVDGKVRIEAEKYRGGGLFKLVLATKDSYNQDYIYDDASLDEAHFNTKYELVIRVSDGTKNASYIINKVEDLQSINYNLDKHFVLNANLGEDEPVDIKPLGVVDVDGNIVVKPFTGSLNGQFTTVVGGNQEKTTSYSIRLHVNKTVASAEGYLAGLIAIIDEEATVSNLKLDISFGEMFASSDETNGLHVGSLAGINKGKINNVQVTVVQQQDSVVMFSSSGTVRLGGIVGTNYGEISHARSESFTLLEIKSDQYQTHSIGLIAGENGISGEIYGSYEGKESLNNYVYDVIADLKVQNTNQLNDSHNVEYYVGSAVGTNKGLISGILVGGQISMSTFKDANVQAGAIGGIVGNTIDGKVYLSTALSLNINSTSSGVDVGGIVGSSSAANIDTVKYISAITSINGSDVLGVLSGENYVGGIVGNAISGRVKYASVESFIDEYNNEDFYTITNGTTVVGLAHTSGTNVENSFVNANIKGTSIYLTTNGTETNTYFIGKTSGTVSTINAKYYINNSSINVNAYMLPVVHEGITDWTNIYTTTDNVTYTAATEFNAATQYYYSVDATVYKEIVTVSSNTTNWTNIYTTDNVAYIAATEFDATKTYKQLDYNAWQAYAYSMVGLSVTDGIWIAEQNYNVINVNGVDLFLPYLVRSWDHDNDAGTANATEPLLIIKPQSITAVINPYYQTSSDSVYVEEFDYSEIASMLKETLVVNFFKDAGDEANSHFLFNDGTNNGLLDLALLPEDAQGGYAYEIVGDGHSYAYINSRKQIVFTRVSNQTPIIVKVYSVFNTEIEFYVAFYSQSLLTELTLDSSSIYYTNQATHEYEINAYTGQNNKVMSLDAENVYDGGSCQDIFDIESLSQYLKITQTSSASESKLIINTDNSQSMTLRIRDDLKDDERIGADEFEIVTFSLFLKAEYFGFYNGTEQYVQNDVLVETIRLKVNLYNSATSIDVDGGDSEITTADDISLNVTLTTQFVADSLYESVNTRVEEVKVNSQGELYNEVSDGDSIRIKFEIVEGLKQAEDLCKANNKEHFAELFLNNAQIVSSLYKAQGGDVLGYQYRIFLELEDNHVARYIESNIKFNIIVYASSSSDVNNEDSPIEILLKPTVLKTARMENYVVKSLKMHTDYADIVANDNIETSIIEPGGLGNVMMIYLEPSYAQVTSASITTGELYVPSLGKTVQVKFTQLALDYRSNPNGVFTTLSGGRGNSQAGDTLDLNLISEIDRNGNDVYKGIILVRIHIEEPFVGMEASLRISINVKTENNPEGITRHRDLLTSYLPGTEISYNEDRAISDGYLIQKGTSNNEVTLKIYGYQFNSNPDLEFVWELPESSAYSYVDANNKAVITDGTKQYLVGDYVSYYLERNINDIVYNKFDDSYTLKLMLNVADNIPAPFRLSAGLQLVTKDGQIKTTAKNENTLIFYPTKYIINSVYVAGLPDSGRKNIAINQTKSIELKFTTDSGEVNDLTLSEMIYDDLLNYAKDDNKLAKMFTYYKGEPKDFALSVSEFEYELVYQEETGKYIISITGLEKFNSIITFKFDYAYKFVNGEYVVEFGTQSKVLSTTFTLNILSEDKVKETIVYSAEDIYNSSTGEWLLVEGGHYVLVNDIELEQVTPITTKIGSFDGNNRVISIKSFRVNTEATDFGLFANIGTYTIEDPETEQQHERQTILKNMIVDYSKFEGTLALNNNINPNLIFGGLVATNNGGLIYNCDVMNLNAGTDKEISIIVSKDANLVFGGLVGENKGIITNSRVGRASYTKVTATPTTESIVEKHAGGLTFEISNQVGNNDVNQFAITAGGFVGTNSGVIASSYITNTNLKNYSTNESSNITAGFAGRNSGTISYSYAKGDDTKVTIANPYATDYAIENLGNGIVSGFVYDNSGTINNSYSNIELKTNSAYISGFVYNNTGLISESYAATTMNSGLVDSFAEQPFVGVDSKGDLLSFGTLENTYYLMRSSTDNPYVDEDKDVAQALNEDNFQNSEYLVGFAFVLSNSKAEREQGIWSYYTTTNKKRVLPELMNANIVSNSHRYVVETENQEKVLRNAVSFAEGTANNPYTISNVEEFNTVFTGPNAERRDFKGSVRFINNINFNDDETAIQTRSNYVLGSTQSSTKSSVEGNGMTISGIYLDVGDAVVNKIGLFAEVQNAYIKNLNLKFATPKTDGQFSTTTAMYSGGLAGKIENSAIINIDLDGANTTLTGSNFVGGVAGFIGGNSLIYGIETNLNVKAGCTEGYLYYSEKDYNSLNIKLTSHYDYSNYLKHLSYSGGVAGVLDLTKRSNIEYNVQFIDIRGDEMTAKTFGGKHEANILAEYAGGVAGYASDETQSFKLRYFIGDDESIRGDTAVGGLYAVSLGGIIASQVAAEEDTQYKYDTAFGDYIKSLYNQVENAQINKTLTGNLNLLEGDKYVGGLVGVGLDANINSSYSKATMYSGEIVGGLVGLNVAGIINYSYSIPYVNAYEGLKSVGGLIGEAYAITPRTPERNGAIATYEALLKLKGTYNKTTDVQFTYSTLILDEESEKLTNVNYDYICADYDAEDSACLSSNNNSSLMYVYAGTVQYQKVEVNNQTNETNKSSIVALNRLYNIGDPDQVVAFQEVFSGWSLIKYWSLNDEKYFPLLNNETVDNFIEIDHENDLAFIRTNPSGKFKVIDDIVVTSETTANWIVSGKFTGVLVGELENDSRRPTITINGLKPNKDNASAGFFEETHNATISNISFVWSTKQGTNPAINLSGVEHITMVSGLTCKDENSLISNVEVRTSLTGEEGYGRLIDDNTHTIGGFGGIVGDSSNTNILGCSYIGQVKAIVKDYAAKDVYIGGAVGYIKTDNQTGDSAVINNVLVGAAKGNSDEFAGAKYPKTSFDITVASATTSSVYIGGSVGRAEVVAIATNNVGGSNYESDYADIDINVKLENLSKSLYLGGVVGYAQDGMISNCEALTNIQLTGKTSDSATPMLRVGGLAGDYSLGNPSNTTGISKCNARANISTQTNDGKLEAKTATAMLSNGVARLGVGATLKQCLFSGEINTEGSIIGNVYAGGASASVESSENQIIDLEEITTDAVLVVGTSSTQKIYAGGLVGRANRLEVSYSAALGRVAPITSEAADEIYAGGLFGLLAKLDSTKESEKVVIKVNNTYSLTSVIADSIADSAIANLNVGALVGSISELISEENKILDNFNFEQVYYSSDYALCTDENQLQNGLFLGMNLSATTMIRTNVWHSGLKTEDEKNTIWKSSTVAGGVNMVPYLSSLEESLIKFGILTKPTGETTFNYVQGSAMRPIEISSNSEYIFNQDRYNYYLLSLADKAKTPKFTNALNGILIGEDKGIDKTFRVGDLTSCGIILKVNKHSAISNLHVVLENNVSVTDLTGIIAITNEGVIFNSSVQGNGITFDGPDAASGKFIEAGLISGKNEGLISHSFSTAEIIINGNVQLGGIVNTNEGKLLSNYFTGYIEGGESAGILVTNNYGYVYNNYMAGVITSIKGNAFHVCENIAIAGSNNFIDIYSDLAYAHNEERDESKLKPVQTAELMAKAGLKGNWYATVEDGDMDTSKLEFGLNYNYPVYEFNKMISTNGRDFTCIDLDYQLYTGKGGKSKTEAYDNEDLDVRYSYIVNNTGSEEIDTKYYHAFKIPHLGVLTAVQALLNESRNYVLIYDINGKYAEDTFVEWTAVGTDTVKNRGEETETDLTLKGFKYSGSFKGVFVTNKYFAYNVVDMAVTGAKESDSYCVVKNLSINGLFANINGAYIGSVKLGSFHNLNASGALGTNIIGNATINNVEFLKNTIVSSEVSYGGLFGEVAGTLQVNKIVTGESGTANVCLSGSSISTVGLISGKLTGTIKLIEGLDSTYYAWFNGNGYAGGVVGEILGGTISGNKIGGSGSEINAITIYQTDKSGEEVDMYTGFIGGIAGKGYTSADGISSLVVQISTRTIKTNSFGGVIGEVVGEQEGDKAIIDEVFVLAEEVIFHGNSEKNRYYGFMVGLQNADVEATGLGIKSSILTVGSTDGNGNFEETSKNTGVGTYVGANNGYKLSVAEGSSINSGEEFMAINVLGIPNLGGYVGYMKIKSDLQNQINLPISETHITLRGTTNVGGLFGYLDGSINATTFVNNGEESLIGGANYATVNIYGSITGNKYQNFGGLFGIWEGTNATDEEIINNNGIAIKHYGEAFNVGGVAGKIITGEISKLKNTGEIQQSEEDKFYKTDEINGTYIHNNEVLSMVKLMNVGGIFGYAYNSDEEAISITEIYNTADIAGYQNVGGLVGYSNNAAISNPRSTTNLLKYDLTKIKVTDDFVVYYDVDGNDDKHLLEPTLEQIIAEISESEQLITGNVYGVINVGGAIGYTGKKVEVSDIISLANVYGNTSVGGLVGLTNQATLLNNFIIGTKEEDGEIISGEVKGIYYNFVELDKDLNEEIKSFIPTSVGGLVGTSVNSRIENNVLAGVEVTSTEERSSTKFNGGSVISTISNYMSDVKIGATNTNTFEDKFTKTSEIYNLDKLDKIDYTSITSGFGGFIGTIDSESMNSVKIGNYILDSNVKAELGINVGSYYGAYKFENLVTLEEGVNSALVTPALMGKIGVDGAYNIGGIVGFIDGGTGITSNFNISNETITGKAQITVQGNLAGVYVGGLVGRTNANSIQGLSILTSASKSIKINTNNSYYAGGLIGKAEVGNGANISGNVGDWQWENAGTQQNKFDMQSNTDEIYSGNNAENFGALIGMLKVAKSNNDNGFSVKVAGNHKLPFTINTIENSNYYDGDSRFASNKDDKLGIALYAEAYYVNKDSFDIVGSKDETLYDNNNDTNPLNKNAQGWSKQYTGFKQLQRLIPNDENKADWDSISVLYDAARITHVGTIGNMGFAIDSDGKTTAEFKTKNGNEKLSKDHICYTIYEQADGEATLYSAMGIASLMKLYDEYTQATIGELQDPNTEKFYYDPYLQQYVSIGKKQFDVSITNETKKLEGYFKEIGRLDIPNKVLYVKEDSLYTTPKDIIANVALDSWNNNWIASFVTKRSPYNEYYIDANNSDNGLQALSYFTWGENGAWKSNYKSLSGKDTSIQNTIYQKDDNGATNSGRVSYLTYFVSNYLNLNTNTSENGATYKTLGEGAYFKFDVIYENTTASKLPYTIKSEYDVLNLGLVNWVTKIDNGETPGYSDDYLPNSGSIFEVNGMYTPQIYVAQKLHNPVDWAGVAIKAAWLVGEIVISLIPGAKAVGGIFKAGWKALKHAGKKAVKKAVMKNVMRLVKRVGIKKIAAWGGFVIFSFVSVTLGLNFMYDNSMSYQNFTQPMQLNFGYLSTTYTKEITYVNEDGKVVLSQSSDYLYTDNWGNTYYYYSNVRPDDYHANQYLAQRIETRPIEDYSYNGTKIDVVYEINQIYLEEGVIPLKETDMSSGWPQERHVLVTEDDATDPTVSTAMLAEYEGQMYIVSKKYVYRNGQYYINENAGELERKPTTLDFRVETYASSTPYAEPNYITYGNRIYVHGQYSAETYTYDYNGDSGYRYTDNNLTYSDGAYKINGFGIDTTTATNSEISMKYVPYPQINSETLKPEQGHGYEGYNYFQHVYYTADGTQGVKDGETDLVKYATFEYIGNYGKVDLPEGKQGVDYLILPYTFDGYYPNSNGKYLKIEADHVLISNYKQFILDEDGKHKEVERNGEYILYGEEYIEIKAENRYSLNPELQGVFKIKNDTAFSDTGESTDLLGKARNFNNLPNKGITVPVYPSTFKNPYKNAPTGAKDSKHTWIYSDDKNVLGISFAPTYFIYEGGYVTADDAEIVIDSETGKMTNYPLIYTPMAEDEYIYEVDEDTYKNIKAEWKFEEDGKYYAYKRLEVQEMGWKKNEDGEDVIDLVDGTKSTISFKQLIEGWDGDEDTVGYKDYYSLTEESPVSDIYQVVDGKLYSLNMLYSLDENGLLCKLSMKPFNDGRGNVYSNMYLTNQDVQLYTRYKFSSNGQPLYLKGIKEWGSYTVVPTKEGETIINYNTTTRLVESARVILSGGNNNIILNNSKASEKVSSGNIKIS